VSSATPGLSKMLFNIRRIVKKSGVIHIAVMTAYKIYTLLG
jgi:hypothetical protein